ncbi:MAG: hypothetical protein E7451_06770 [Ruminococcaceae bacterium]|nr:hypothetical protein [Oscillospiraceae bacterium]
MKYEQFRFWFSKETFFAENSENFPLLLEIDMLVCNSVKVASFGGFPLKMYLFDICNRQFLPFSILTKGAAFLELTLVQNTQGSRMSPVPEGLPADRCPRHTIKIHFGGI